MKSLAPRRRETPFPIEPLMPDVGERESTIGQTRSVTSAEWCHKPDRRALRATRCGEWLELAAMADGSSGLAPILLCESTIEA
jgi:hypothetical protein